MSVTAWILLAALGVATVLSIVLWQVSRWPRRRAPSYLEHLDAVVSREPSTSGPPSGVTRIKPIKPIQSQPSQSSDRTPDQATTNP